MKVFLVYFSIDILENLGDELPSLYLSFLKDQLPSIVKNSGLPFYQFKRSWPVKLLVYQEIHLIEEGRGG
ncbi:hypothetical protein CROQUDRAFT_101902 [Cronartium quercuum f. sp. fusiforme G11]|uniref:Uncharacterized protein n=1 Tax=Cronartium quercuum f. sp. fusiforme G11 TaxID=708437 RepID=A0A9P6N525_9BASI|nr:hypothetical protein CROQUDRAFT_101902 [Cronartium quercuum f. sp. fusiforme G11]